MSVPVPSARPCVPERVAAGERAVVLDAPAKINLYLGVYPELDERGYHRVDSVMACVGVSDTVRVESFDMLSVEVMPPVDFPMEENSAYKAAVRMAAAFDREPHVRIEIEKRIPARAGLGGASADAAAAIKGICRLWGCSEEDDRVVAVARSVGADVPFFLYDAPAYLAAAGDVLEELYAPIAIPVVLVKPGQDGITAQEAYARFDDLVPSVAPIAPMRAALQASDADAVCRAIANNLEPVAIDLVPALDGLLAWLRGQDGVRDAQVTGSGSCTFALCETAEQAEEIARAAHARGWWSVATTLLERGVAAIEG